MTDFNLEPLNELHLDWSHVKISYPRVYLLQSQTPHTIILFQHVYWNVKHKVVHQEERTLNTGN